MSDSQEFSVLSKAMKQRVRTLIQSRLKVCSERLAEISSMSCAPSAADTCLFRMAQSMRALILQACRGLHRM